MYQERAKRKPNLTFYCELLRKQNSPWYSLFGYNILRQGVTITMGINFKPKNPVEVLHFHKIQILLNVSKICTPKIREKGISRKHLVLGGEKKRTCNNNPLDLQTWFVQEGRA